jgi:thioredoxin 1
MIKLMKFTTPGCRYCSAVSNYVNELQPELYAQGVIVEDYNTTKVPDLVEKYNIAGAPTLLFVRNGVEITRITGMTDQETILDCVREAKEGR